MTPCFLYNNKCQRLIWLFCTTKCINNNGGEIACNNGFYLSQNGFWTHITVLALKDILTLFLWSFIFPARHCTTGIYYFHQEINSYFLWHYCVLDCWFRLLFWSGGDVIRLRRGLRLVWFGRWKVCVIKLLTSQPAPYVVYCKHEPIGITWACLFETQTQLKLLIRKLCFI